LLTDVIDERARANHKQPYASIPLTGKTSDGFRDISYRVFANAIDRTAAWLLDSFGGCLDSFETIVYVGASDLRYQILAIAAVKSGFVVRYRQM
jgi:hypothetical protein